MVPTTDFAGVISAKTPVFWAKSQKKRRWLRNARAKVLGDFTSTNYNDCQNPRFKMGCGAVSERTEDEAL